MFNLLRSRRQRDLEYAKQLMAAAAEGEQRAKINRALGSAGVQLPPEDDNTQYCIKAASALVRVIMVRAGVDMGSSILSVIPGFVSKTTNADERFVGGIFAFVASNHLTRLVEAPFETVAGIVPMSLFGPDHAGAAPELINSYNQMAQQQSKLIQAIGQNIAKFIDAPTDEQLDKLARLFKLCAEQAVVPANPSNGDGRPESVQETVRSHRDHGLASLGEANYDDAIAHYTKAIALDPEDDDLYYMRGNSYQKKGEFDRAIADFDKAIALDPEDDEYYYWRGRTYQTKGEFDRAIADFDKVIALDPKDFNAYDTRGKAYYSKGEADRAIADFTKAITLYPNDALAYTNRGIAYEKKGEVEWAVVDYCKALEIDPSNQKAKHNLKALGATP